MIAVIITFILFVLVIILMDHWEKKQLEHLCEVQKKHEEAWGNFMYYRGYREAKENKPLNPPDRETLLNEWRESRKCK